MNEDVRPEDALAIAQRALQKISDLERTVADLEEEVTRLTLLTSEYEDRAYERLDRDTKVGRVREYLFEKANARNGRAQVDYDDVIWGVFDGEPSADHAYTLMGLAADYRGFAYHEDRRPRVLTCDAREARQSVAFSSANKTRPEVAEEI